MAREFPLRASFFFAYDFEAPATDAGYLTIIPRVRFGYEMVEPTSPSGIVVSLKTTTKYREFFPTLFVKATRTVDIFGEHGVMADIP